jgi:hypothetical protein
MEALPICLKIRQHRTGAADHSVTAAASAADGTQP